MWCYGHIHVHGYGHMHFVQQYIHCTYGHIHCHIQQYIHCTYGHIQQYIHVMHVHCSHRFGNDFFACGSANLIDSINIHVHTV